MSSIVNVVLNGGAGSRLWPISREKAPKQFLRLFGNESLFQKNIKRNHPLIDQQIVVVNEAHLALSKSQTDATDCKDKQVSYITEPMGRNTAAAIALACWHAGADTVLLVTPADHLIHNEAAYQAAVEIAIQAAQQDKIITFGIRPTRPETGYGYIQVDPNQVEDNLTVLPIQKFLEKPTIEKATQFLAQGNYYWNSGMFCFKAGVLLKELQKWAPNIYHYSEQAYQNGVRDNNGVQIQAPDMEKIPEKSIDYAVMEHSKEVVVVPTTLDWNDLGSFDALYDVLPKDEDGTTIYHNYAQINSKNNLIIGDQKSKRKVVMIDVEDTIVIDTEDTVLITKRGSSQKVKELVQSIKNNSL